MRSEDRVRSCRRCVRRRRCDASSRRQSLELRGNARSCRHVGRFAIRSIAFGRAGECAAYRPMWGRLTAPSWTQRHVNVRISASGALVRPRVAWSCRGSGGVGRHATAGGTKRVEPPTYCPVGASDWAAWACPQVRSTNLGGQGAVVLPPATQRWSHRSQPQARVLVRRISYPIISART